MNNTKWNEIGHKFWDIECSEDILIEWDVKFINYDYVENYEWLGLILAPIWLTTNISNGSKFD